jgi:large subunit ribosomal protein L22
MSETSGGPGVAELDERSALSGVARARYLPESPRKLRRMVDLIRGLPAEEARAVLTFAPQAASEAVSKALASAVANAEHLAHTRGERLDADSLWVSRAFVDEGPTLKRFRPRAQGRAYRVRKRTSHLTVVVAAMEPSSRGRPARTGRAS